MIPHARRSAQVDKCGQDGDGEAPAEARRQGRRRWLTVSDEKGHGRPGSAMVADVATSRAPLLSDQLCFAVYAASHALSRRYKPLLAQLDLTYPQYLCMLVLWERDDQTVGAIGDRLYLDSGTLTPLLKRLEAAGLCRRVRDTADERQVRISLTEKGRALAPLAASLPETLACSGGFALADLAPLREVLRDLRRRLDDGPD